MINFVIVASKLYGVNATIIIFVFVLYCIVLFYNNYSFLLFFLVFIKSNPDTAGNGTKHGEQ